MASRVREQTYAVVGSTAAELAAVVRTLGPTRGGVVFAAYSDWSIGWGGDRSALGEAWTVENPTVTVDVVVTLPRWLLPRSASPNLVESWRQYVGALRAHELGHVRLAIQHGEVLAASLEALGAFASGDLLDRAASNAAGAAMNRLRCADAQYDLLTAHGQRQGAIFPPIGGRSTFADHAETVE